jgi:hypothetical protein
MQNWFSLSLSVLMGFTLVACDYGKPQSMKLGNGAYSVTVPKEVSFSCQILQHASDCQNYNVPGSIEGAEVRLCSGESKSTKYFAVTGKIQTDLRSASNENISAGFVAGWSKCQDGKISPPQQISIEGKEAMDYVVSTPLGEGNSRVYVDTEYSVMALAVPKHSGSKNEIDEFVQSLRPVAQK